MLGLKLSQLSSMVIPMMTLNCKGQSTRGIFAPTLGATFSFSGCERVGLLTALSIAISHQH